MAASLSITVYLTVIMVLLFPLCVYLVVYFAEPGFPWHTYITAAFGYFASFGILLLVPIDIASVVVDRRSTETLSSSAYNNDVDVLSTMYGIFFGIVLVLGSFLMVFEEYYNSDGYSTICGRMWSSFKRMLKDNGPGLIAGVIVLAVVLGLGVVDGNLEALKLSAIIVTNTVYEAILMFLLGYALVEYPRSIWDSAFLDKALLNTQMKAASEFKVIQDAQLDVSLVVSDALKTQRMLAETHGPEITSTVSLIVSECPQEFRSDRMGKVAANAEGEITVDTLAELRTRLNVQKSRYKAAQLKVEGTKIRAYMLEDMVLARDAVPPRDTIHWSLPDKASTIWEYNWYLKYKPWLLMIASIACMVLSVFSFLGVVCSMHGVSNSVSVYFQAVHSDNGPEFGIVLFILVTLGYTAYIMTWALFQIKVVGSMELVPHRTTPSALSFNVRMNARLAAPLAFFYLGWLSENGIKKGSWLYNDAPAGQQIFMPSSFSDFYQLQSVGIIKSTFGTIFPIILFSVLFLFLINAFNRILVLIKWEAYQFGTALVTEEQLREGKRQLQRNKRATERTFRRGDLSEMITAVGKPASPKKTLLGAIMSSMSQSSDVRDDLRSTRDPHDAHAESVDVDPTEPPPLATAAEKKTTRGVSGQWKTCYVEVRSPGFLHISKDKKTADTDKVRSKDPAVSTERETLVIDLSKADNFTIPDRKGKDNTCLDVATRADTHRIKFKDMNTAITWKHQLQQWKDFNVDYGKMYPYGVDVGRVKGSAGAGSTRNPLAPSATKGSMDDAEEDEETGGGRASGVQLSPLLDGGGGRGGSPVTPRAGAAVAPPPPMEEDPKPDPLEGWLEKKSSGKVKMGEGWQKRYMRIDEARSALCYYKTSNISEAPNGVIDLKLVTDISVYHDRNGADDYTRFNIDLGDKVFKFKVNSAFEGKKWVNGLNEWRDYFLMNMA
mmetsp:Transcript_6631/g.11152  ORF Transcript_6631/g.11152 Transcript_6631/m.11152 type:complete len:947 (+) Transcript_6631:145-2985(+)